MEASSVAREALGPPSVTWSTARKPRLPWDAAYRNLLGTFALFVFVIAALIVYECARGASPALLAYGWRFLLNTEWDPVAEHFGALPYVFGTAMSSALALLLAVPLGLGSAVFLAELAPRRVGTAVAFVIELLASIPSIVYGIWGFFVLAPFLRSVIEPWLGAHLGFIPLFQGFPFGIGMLNAGIVLAIMILPTIVSLTRELLRATPRSLLEASLALGSTKAEALAAVVDAARPGILGAIVLALGRALGETMAVTMVIGNTNRISASLFAPGATMSSVIANELTEATTTLHQASLIEIALVLLLLTLLVNAAGRLLVLWATGGRRDVAGAA